METAFERVTAALIASGSVNRGGNWNCPGPAHGNGDRRPSLSVDQGRRGVVLKCFTGCGVEDILMPLGLKETDLFDGPPQEVARYNYTNADGEVLFAKVRFEPKTFRIEHPTDEGWVPGINGSDRPLYNLPEVLLAVKQQQPIWIVNGEKSVERLRELGETATCNFEGETTWKTEYSSYLQGAQIVIVADRDETGVQHAIDISASLKNKSQVRVVQSKTEGEHDDVVDHLDAGHKLTELVPLRLDNEISRRYRRIDWAEAFTRQAHEVDWLLPPVLEAGTSNALFGKPGTGKSLIALEWAVSIVREENVVVYVDDENRISDTVDRLRAFGCSPAELDRLVMYNFAGLPPLDTDEGGQHLSMLAEVNGAAMVVLDTTTRMVMGDENSANTWLQLYRCSLVPLKGKGITVLRIDHPGKDDTRGQRGSSAKAGDVDAVWRLAAETGDLITLVCEKSRSGHHEEAITYKRHKRIDSSTGQTVPGSLSHEILETGRLGEVLPQIRNIARKLDEWGIPKDAGRPSCRDELRSHNYECSTTILALAVKYRKGQ